MIASIFEKILECGFLKAGRIKGDLSVGRVLEASGKDLCLSKINELTDAVQMYKKLSRVCKDLCNDPCQMELLRIKSECNN